VAIRGKLSEMELKKLSFIIAVASLVISGCSRESERSQGQPPKEASTSATEKNLQDGLSFDSAIVIQAKDESAGVAAEYAWIRKNLPGARSMGQSLSGHAGKPYDVIHIKLPDGKLRDVYFEISSYFGR